MTHIFHLDASSSGACSVSSTLAKECLSNRQSAHPSDDTVNYRYIGHHPVLFVTEAWIAGAFTPPDKHSPESAEVMRISDKLIDEFLAADRYVFSILM